MHDQKLWKKFTSEYIAAGADIIQTNTYGANAIKLARYGYEERVKEFNEAALEISESVQQHQVTQFVLATIGGIRGIRKSDAR